MNPARSCSTSLLVLFLVGCGVKTSLPLRPQCFQGDWIGYGPDYAVFRVSLTNYSGGAAMSVTPANRPVKVNRYTVQIREVRGRQRQIEFDMSSQKETFNVVGELDYPYLKCKGTASYGGTYRFLLLREAEFMNCVQLLDRISSNQLLWTNKSWDAVDSIP